MVTTMKETGKTIKQKAMAFINTLKELDTREIGSKTNKMVKAQKLGLTVQSS